MLALPFFRSVPIRFFIDTVLKSGQRPESVKEGVMATASDVARYILDRLAPDKYGSRVTAWKLQKLVYYSQAWSLVWDEEPLFEDEIQAWANGPVTPSLYEQHRGRFNLYAGDIDGDPSALTKDERETVDAVLRDYGDKKSQWLSDLTHSEAPWKDARRGTPEGARSQSVITQAAMAEYYESL